MDSSTRRTSSSTEKSSGSAEPEVGDMAGDSSGNLNPDPRWPYLHRWAKSTDPSPPIVNPPSPNQSEVLLSPDSSTAANGVSSDLNSVENNGALSTPSGSVLRSPVATILDGNNQDPDARSPYQGRRSFKSTPPPSRIAKVAKVDAGNSSGNSAEASVPKTLAASAPTTHLPPTQLGNPQSRLGAWAKPITFNSTSTLMDTIRVGGVVDSITSSTPISTEVWPALEVQGFKKKGIALQKSFKDVTQEAIQHPAGKEDNLRFPWAAKMNPALRNLYRATEPEYLEDGTPKVMIPKHVLLEGLENQKEYILGQFYRCSPPPGGLIFAVFNKLWGRTCKITIRKLGEANYLFHIPDKETRTWVLQRGLWHVDDCLMFVAPWTPEGTLEIPEIKTMPVWVTLKKIPNILYTLKGVSHIASGLGAPMATYKPRLDPFMLGEAKILVEVELSKAFPPRIAASDDSGFISMVDVEYAWLPTKCSRCGELGHKLKRCLQSSKDVLGTSSDVPTTDSCPTQQTVSHGHDKSREVNPSSKLVIPVSGSLEEELPIPKSADTITTTTPDSDVEVSLSTSLVTVSNKPSSDDQTAPTIIVKEPIETPLMASAKTTPTICKASAQVSSTIHGESSRIIEPDFGSNKFGSLISLEGEEDSSDSDNELDPADLLTPSGKRILRERPVKPSAKAKEMYGQTFSRGRGGRGRGSRGGRG